MYIVGASVVTMGMLSKQWLTNIDSYILMNCTDENPVLKMIRARDGKGGQEEVANGHGNESSNA